MIVELINQHADRLSQVGLHFLWQGTAIAILAAILSRFLITNPRHRATLFLASLFALFLCVPLTLMNISSPPPEQIVTPPTSFETGIPTDHLAVEPLEMSPSAPSPLPISFWIAGVYFTGLFLMMVRVILGYRWCSKIRRHGKAINNGPWHDALTEAISKMKLRSKPIMIWSEKVTSPVVTGILRPMIVLPISLMSGLPQDQAIAILSHELAHLKRFDHFIVVFQRLLEALFFFHPAVWFLSRRLDQEREKACDDLVLNTGSNRADYAEALVTIASDQKPSFALSAAGNKQLTERVLRILNHRQPTTVRVNRGGWLTIAAAITLLGVFSFSPAQSQEKENEEQGKPAKKIEETALMKSLQINLPEMSLHNVTLVEAMKFLRHRSIELNPEGQGINIVVRNVAGKKIIDNLVLRNVTFQQAFQAICLKTGMQYKVDEFAVTILPKQKPADNNPGMVQRSWVVPPDFLKLIAAEGIPPKSRNIAEHLEALAVSFPPETSAAYLSSSSTLIVRNTPDNLELIDNIVQASTDPVQAKLQRARANKGKAERAAEAATDKTLVQRKWTTPPDFFTRLAPKGVVLELKSTKEHLAAHGVTFPGASAAAYVKQKNLLIVRNTPANLDLIDKLILKTADPKKRDKEQEARLKQLDELNKIMIPRAIFKNTTLEEAVDFMRLRALELDPAKKGVNINFFGDERNLNPINLDLRNVPLPVLLSYVCNLTKTRYTIEGRNISILPIEN